MSVRRISGSLHKWFGDRRQFVEFASAGYQRFDEMAQMSTSSSRTLLKMAQLPLDWAEQRRRLRFKGTLQFEHQPLLKLAATENAGGSRQAGFLQLH